MTENGANNMVMPVSPMNGGFGGYGSGCFGGDWAWIILLLLAFGGGWGNGFRNNEGVMPYLWNNQTQNDVNRGFADAALTSQLSAIQASQVAAETNNANRAFDMQSAFSNCCCENRLGLANLGADIAREACADRAAVSDGIRDILANQSANTQRILDQMCNDKIDAKNERIADLERQLTMANLAASQNAQTATILANNEAQTTALEQYLAPTPRPAYIVQNPNCCQQNYGCGCGL
jgi:hypothetical protein